MAVRNAYIGYNIAPCSRLLPYLDASQSRIQGLPQQFAEYLAYCRSLKFEAKPNVPYLQVSASDLGYNSGCTGLINLACIIFMGGLCLAVRAFCRDIPMLSGYCRYIQPTVYVFSIRMTSSMSADSTTEHILAATQGQKACSTVPIIVVLFGDFGHESWCGHLPHILVLREGTNW